MGKTNREIKRKVKDYIEQYVSTLKGKDRERCIIKGGVLYNYIVEENPSASQIQEFSELLFECKETYLQLMQRLK